MRRCDYYSSEVVQAGCHECDGNFRGNPKWAGKNGQALAKIHHDRTGHATFVDLEVAIGYGKRPS